MRSTSTKNNLEWQTLAEAENAAASEDRTGAELKKRWSDIKVEAKKRMAHHRQSVSATGGSHHPGEVYGWPAKLREER